MYIYMCIYNSNQHALFSIFYIFWHNSANILMSCSDCQNDIMTHIYILFLTGYFTSQEFYSYLEKESGVKQEDISVVWSIGDTLFCEVFPFHCLLLWFT